MSDRIAAFTVTLERDIRADDAKAIRVALSMVKGVLIVEPIVADPMTLIAESRARQAFADKIWAVLYPTVKP